MDSAKATCTWFAITKALNSNYPLWANQYDLWPPQINAEQGHYWHSLCFAFVLAENRCVVTKFEENNPVPGASEVFVDNPLSPNNDESFWCTTLLPYVETTGELSRASAASELIKKITALYKHWNTAYCKGGWLQYVGLKSEPYFRYFSYPDFLTKNSGLIQIRKYAEINEKADLLDLFKEITALSKKVKEELYRMLVLEFKYFE